MATGLSAGAANALMELLTDTYDYVQLHDGDPGSAGTANVADETTRVLVAWTVAGATATNSTALEWDSVTVSPGPTQDYTHFTVWDALTSGSFGFSGTVTSNPVSNGDSFQIPINDLDISLPIAS